MYGKISKNLLAKYYQENKERIQKLLAKDIKIFLKKKKKKSDNMIVNVTKGSQKMKKQKTKKNTLTLVEYKKNIVEWEKMLYYNYRKVI